MRGDATSATPGRTLKEGNNQQEKTTSSNNSAWSDASLRRLDAYGGRFRMRVKWRKLRKPPRDGLAGPALPPAMPTMAPRALSLMTLLATSAAAAPGVTETAIPISALRTTLPVAATSRRL